MIRKEDLKVKISEKTLSYIIICALTAVILLVPVGCADQNDKTDYTVSEQTSVSIGGKEYDIRSTKEFVVSDSDFSDYGALKGLRNLETLDLTALALTAEEYDAIAAQIDDCVEILWNVPFENAVYPNTVDRLVISKNFSSADAEAAQYFTGLKSVTIEKCSISEELGTLVRHILQNNPDVQMTYSSKIYGVKVDSTKKKLKLNYKSITDLKHLRMAIKAFPNITTYEMCECGLSDEVMGGLREEYPDITFVWTVKCYKYKIRTDAQVFSTLVYKETRRCTENDFHPLFQYCTELRALDLGHQGIEDISEISNLTKLQTLILADNRIQDITPLTDLKELNYLEIFQNKIVDASPLTELDNLEDLNITYNPLLKNAPVLTNCKKLKRLYISNSNVSEKEVNELKAGLPEDCEFNSTSYNAVFGGWRTDAKNSKIRDTFSKWTLVKEYRSWDNVVY